jgi:hypothetical protein
MAKNDGKGAKNPQNGSYPKFLVARWIGAS